VLSASAKVGPDPHLGDGLAPRDRPSRVKAY
jgi:hypothetical protein